MDQTILSQGPASVVFWETVCWFLWGVIAILAPMAGRYLFLAKKISKAIEDYPEQLKSISDGIIEFNSQYRDILTKLEILLDRQTSYSSYHRSGKRSSDDDVIDIDGTKVSLSDLEQLVSNARNKRRRIDDYYDEDSEE